MKKITYMLGIILGAFLMFSIVSCQQQSSETNEKKDGNQVSDQLYYIEMAELAKSDILQIADGFSQAEASFSEVKEIRNQFKRCTHYNFASMPDITRDECYDFLVTHGSSPSEANQILNKLDTRGNALMAFNEQDPNLAIYIYAEKQ